MSLQSVDEGSSVPWFVFFPDFLFCVSLCGYEHGHVCLEVTEQLCGMCSFYLPGIQVSMLVGEALYPWIHLPGPVSAKSNGMRVLHIQNTCVGCEVDLPDGCGFVDQQG